MAHVGDVVGRLPAEPLDAAGDKPHARGRPRGDAVLERGGVCQGLLDHLVEGGRGGGVRRRRGGDESSDGEISAQRGRGGDV